MAGDAVSNVLIGVFLLGVGAIGLRQSRRIRDGRDRRWVQLYRDDRFPGFLRKAPFVVRYYGWAFIAAGTALVFYPIVEAWTALRALLALPLLLLIVVAIALIGLGIFRSYKVPESLKPAWLIDEETHSVPPPPSRTDRAIDLVTAAIPLALMALVIGIGVVVFILSFVTKHSP